MAPGVTEEQVLYYFAMLDKVKATKEWKDYMELGALSPASLRGAPMRERLLVEAQFHERILKEAGVSR
jgi:putative tricarboxylic transport membrane protein